jgi:RNA polymerase sigma-70 factor (ECF subfamily)
MASPSSVCGFAALAAVGQEPLPEFKRIYDEHLPFIWRAARHLGVAPHAIEDVLQDVFVVVHRRLREFESRSTLRTWIYGILLHMVRNHRRSMRRRRVDAVPLADALVVATGDSPHEALETREAMRTLQTLLDELDDAKREVFVLVELEQLTVPEIAEMLGEKTNTIYGRVRAARQQFDMAVRRHHAREKRTP